jgi:hypothetical protein
MYNDRVMAFATSLDGAYSLLKDHWAYGPAELNGDFCGDAYVDAIVPGKYWWIRQSKNQARKIPGTIMGDPRHETAHVLWKCPECTVTRSEDYDLGCEIVVICIACKNTHAFRQYLVVTPTSV